MSNPRVSVLMSVYNGISYLEDAVSSILGQSFRDFEFIIVNDGSTEPVGDLLRRFKDPRITIISHENMGLTRSLNRGLSLCRGAFVARMDADDISLPQRLERQVIPMESHTNLDLVGCDYDVIDSEGKVCERKVLIQDNVYRLWRLMFHNVYGHGTMLIRKSKMIAVGGYDERFTVAQDYELWSRISKLNNTLVIPEVLYQYRLADQGAQSSVRHYHAQLANAIRISDNSLKQCRPEFSDDDCADVRSVFWKFQRGEISLRGLELLPALLEGFFRHYGVENLDRDRLLVKVVKDVADEVTCAEKLNDSDKPEILRQFQKSISHLWTTSCNPAAKENRS